MGLFIVIDGMDGTGKSTLCENLFNYLINLGKKVIKTREPIILQFDYFRFKLNE